MDSASALALRKTGRANRIEWMDTLRGLSILLVIVHHSFGFTYDDLETAPMWVWGFNEAFQPLRMPMMVFLSGLLVPASLAKGTRRYVTGKLQSVAHPYFVWSFICLVILLGASLTIGREFDESMIWRVFYRPIEHMWFLAFLFLYYLLALALRGMDPLIPTVVAMLIAQAPIGGSWEKFWVLFGFFFVGVSLARRGAWWARLMGNRIWMVYGLVAFAVLLWVSLNIKVVRYDSFFAPLVFVCILGACVATQALGMPRALTSVRFLGKESLIFYVTHYPGILVFLVLLRKVAPELPEMLEFPLSVAFALALGTALVISVNRIPGASWLIRFGGLRPRHHDIGA